MSFYYARESGPEGDILADEGEAPGINLVSLLDQGVLPVRAALELVSNIADILTIAEEDEVFHGDLKPGAVSIDATGTIYVHGYGVERRTTRAPENSPSGPATDVYGLGLLLYATLNLQPMGALPDEQDDHDQFIVDRLLDVDWQNLTDKTFQDKYQEFVCSMLSFETDSRPEALDVANVCGHVVDQLEGKGLAAWAARAVPAAGGARVDKPVTVALEEDLGGPESLAGTVVSQAVVPRKAASAKGENTAFWSRGKIADMLTEDEDEPMRGAWSPTTEDPTVPLTVPPGLDSFEDRSTDIGGPADFDEQPTQVGVPAFPAGPPGAPESFQERPTSVGAPLAPQPPAPDATMRPTQLPGMPGFIQPGPQNVVDHTLQPKPSSWVDPGSTPFGAPQAQATGVAPGAGPAVAPPATPVPQPPFAAPGAAPPMTPAAMPPVTTGAAFSQGPAPAYPPQYPPQAPAQGGSGRGLILGGLGLLGVALVAAVVYIVVGPGGTRGGEVVEVVRSAEEADAVDDQASATDSGAARDPAPREQAPSEKTQRARPPSTKSSSSRGASSTTRSSSRPAAAPEPPPEPTPAPSAGAGAGQLQARIDTDGQKTTLRCNPPPSIGQSVEFVGNQLLSFDSESTCVIKMSGGRGILAVKESGTYVCREDGGAISCGIGR